MKSALHETAGEEDSSPPHPFRTLCFSGVHFQIKTLNIEHTHLAADMEIVVLRKYFLKQEFTKEKFIINIWLRKSAVNSGY